MCLISKMRKVGSFLSECLEEKKDSENLFPGFKQCVREDRAGINCDTRLKNDNSSERGTL